MSPVDGWLLLVAGWLSLVAAELSLVAGWLSLVAGWLSLVEAEDWPAVADWSVLAVAGAGGATGSLEGVEVEVESAGAAAVLAATSTERRREAVWPAAGGGALCTVVAVVGVDTGACWIGEGTAGVLAGMVGEPPSVTVTTGALARARAAPEVWPEERCFEVDGSP